MKIDEGALKMLKELKDSITIYREKTLEVERLWRDRDYEKVLLINKYLTDTEEYKSIIFTQNDIDANMVERMKIVENQDKIMNELVCKMAGVFE